MPAFDDLFRLPGKGGNTPNSGKRIKSEKSHRQRAGTPLKTPSSVTDLHHRQAKRKRSQDRLASDKASKKVRLDPIDLTGDDDTVESSGQSLFGIGNGSRGLIRDTTSVDLTADSEDELDKTETAAPTTPVRKTAQSGGAEKNFGLVTPGTPKTPRPIAQPKRRRPGRIDGQARSDGSSPGQRTIPLTPAHDRMSLLSELPYHSGGLTAGSPGASKQLQSPFKPSPAREATKELVLANISLPAVPEREADRGQLRRGSESVPRVAVRNRTKFIVLLKAPAHELVRIFGRVQRPEIPIHGKCFLVGMAPEIEKIIFKHLLLAADPIQLLNQWSELKRGQTLGLHPEILSTCKAMFFNGREFLYGENTFQYLVRDKPRQGASESSTRRIYIDEYMQYFARVELSIERYRIANAYYTTIVNALHLLIDHGTNLHTLTIDVSPTMEGDTLSTVGYFYKNGDIVEALKTLLPSFFIIRVFTPWSENLRRALDLRTERNRFDKKPMESTQGENDDEDMMKLQQEKLNDICEMMTLACEEPSKVVEDGLFESFEVVPRQDDRRGKRPSTASYEILDVDSEYDDSESNNGDDEDDGDDDYKEH